MDNKSTIFLDMYKFIYEITHPTKSFTWDTLESLIDEVTTILQNAIENKIPIGEDPLLNPIIEEISIMIPKGEFSPTQWKRKQIAKKYQKLWEMYNKVKLPETKEEPIKINNINDYFKVKKFIQTSTVNKYRTYKPLYLSYYETFYDFLIEMKKTISKKYNPEYKIYHLYAICKEIIKDVPNILLDNKINKDSFDSLLALCKLFVTHLESQKHSATIDKNVDKIKYQNARIIKLSLINRYSDRSYTKK